MLENYQKLIDQAVLDGVITPEQYLQIPWNKRYSMRYLFSSDGRQAIIDGFITLERYLQISWNERYTMKYLFSPDIQTQDIFGGPVTPEAFLQVRRNVIKTLQQDPDLRDSPSFYESAFV